MSIHVRDAGVQYCIPANMLLTGATLTVNIAAPDNITKHRIPSTRVLVGTGPLMQNGVQVAAANYWASFVMLSTDFTQAGQHSVQLVADWGNGAVDLASDEFQEFVQPRIL